MNRILIWLALGAGITVTVHLIAMQRASRPELSALSP
jgi:hypothetical protein